MERPLPERIDPAPGLGPQIIERERAAVVPVQAIEGRLIPPVERQQEVSCDLVIRVRGEQWAIR